MLSMLSMTLGTPPVLTARETLVRPEMSYAPVPSRQNIGINNPEQITTADFADANGARLVIYRETLPVGEYRCWFSHVNKSGATIGYALHLTNNGTTAAQVRTRTRGFVSSILGGQAFRDMLTSTAQPTTTTLQPGQSLWMWQINSAATNNTFFNGAIEFDVLSGAIQFDTMAYRSASQLTGTRNYMGYITRVEPDGTRESRVYKGRGPISVVQTPRLEFAVRDSSPVGPMNVLVKQFSLSSMTYGRPQNQNFWFTNIGPAQNSGATTSDMVSWNMPGWGWINPLVQSDADGRYPNLGNWGIEYSVQGVFENRGTRARTFSLNLQAPAGGGSPIAYRGGDGVWRSLRIEPGQNVQYYSQTVQPFSQFRFDARYILGGPGAGSLRNTITLNN